MAEEQKYRIIRKLDAGGMAAVFLAESESIKGFKRRVAIKRILPHLTKNKRFVQMFLDEARLSLQLQHANIVSVFDIGKADNTFFIVMDFIDGANLKNVIDMTKKRGELIPMEQAIYIVREICEGLAYAHDQRDMESGEPLGIVHRDVSPPNILISIRGEIKLTDFGLAKATSQLEQTDPGVVKGKFSYLSPEAAAGTDLDSRADIFSAGIILWELLTGRRLFFGESDYHTVELVRKADIPPMSEANPDVPKELEAILLRALERDPNERYGSAPEFGEALTRFLFGHGMAVGRHDIARLIQKTISQKTEEAKPKRVRDSGGIIDALIQEEIVKFTSLDDLDDPLDVGSKPLSPEDISVAEPLDPAGFVDPRAWADDMSGEGLPDLLEAPSAIAPEEISGIGEELELLETEELEEVEEPVLGVEKKREVVKEEPSEESKKAGVMMASHRMPSPAPKEEKSGLSVILWGLVVLSTLIAVGAALWFSDLI